MREFLEKRWWQGVGGIAGIIALVLVMLQFLGIVNISGFGVSIALNIILAIVLMAVATWTIRLKRQYKAVGTRMEKAREIIKQTQKATERKRVLLPDENQMWKLNIDNPLLTELYGEAHARAISKFHDAKLSSLDIIVDPYQKGNRVGILFGFYSRWADRECTYIVGEIGDIEESQPSRPAVREEDRVTLDELPWVKGPNWPQFLRKSCEKVGPLPPTDRTGYHISARAYLEPQWSINFKDGVTGKESRFSWDGKGDPIPEE